MSIDPTLAKCASIRFPLLFAGISVACVVLVFLESIYYIVILAWSVFYFTQSLTSVLPWSHCNNTWNTPR